MSFRSRLLLAVAVTALVPLGLFALAVRQETSGRLEETYRQRTEAVAAGIRHELRRERERLQDRLDALAGDLRADNRLRRALASGSDRGYRLDWAGGRMRTAGLDALQLQDGDGRILSSGHFRNEFGRRESGLTGALAASAAPVLVTFRRPEGPFLALAAAREVRLGDERYALVGGLAVRDRLMGALDRGGPVSVALTSTDGDVGEAPDHAGPGVPLSEGPRPDGGGRAGDAVTRVELPWLEVDGSGPVRRRAALVVRHSGAPLRALLGRTDRWLLVAVGAVGLGALLLAWWVSSRMGRPLETLADRARRLDLERLDVRFDREGRTDEVGELARTLDTTTARLREEAARLREAERRAAVGDLARQVNHDVRNALAPLRAAVRQLSEAVRQGPEAATEALREREGSLEAALDYLETLAGRYRDLERRPERGPSDVNRVVRRATEGLDPAGGRLRLDLAEELPPVRADAVALRRIVENLVRNGLEALEDGGEVVVSTATAVADAGPGAAGGDLRAAGQAVDDAARSVRIAVRDTGPGLTEQERDRVFEAFYTTRPDGTGLGLSIVRRLVNDLDGRLQLESELGRGSRFVVTLPAGGRPQVGQADGDRPGPAARPGGET